MFYIVRLFSQKKATVAATGTASSEIEFSGRYPTRVFVENTTGAPTAIGFELADPASASAAFQALYSGASALSISVTPGKWVELSDHVAKLLDLPRCKVTCAAWSAGGRIWFDTST